MKAELFLDARARLAEGPVYDETAGLLYWVDIERKAVHVTDPATAADAVRPAPSRVGMLCLTETGELYAALEDGLYLWEDGRFERKTRLPGKEGVRSNDGGCDAKGRLWLGTMAVDGTPKAGSLYRITGGECREMLQSVSCSNGLCFSHDNRFLYYIDTPSGKLWRFDFDLETGSLENRTAIIDYTGEQGGFDGMTIDREGQLWIAQWGGWQISAWDPQTGKKQAQIEVPAPNVSCCAFGGRDFQTLYITTAYTEGCPGSGKLYACRDTGAFGVPAYRYRP